MYFSLSCQRKGCPLRLWGSGDLSGRLFALFVCLLVFLLFFLSTFLIRRLSHSPRESRGLATGATGKAFLDHLCSTREESLAVSLAGALVFPAAVESFKGSLRIANDAACSRLGCPEAGAKLAAWSASWTFRWGAALHLARHLSRERSRRRWKLGLRRRR